MLNFCRPSLLLLVSVCFIVGTFNIPEVNAVNLRHLVVQTRIYIDKSGVDKWRKNSGLTDLKKMKAEITSLFVDITDIYKSFINTIDFEIKFEILSMTVMDTNLFSVGTHGNKAIKAFSNWVKPTHKDGPYDMALLLTGTPMTGGIGFGYIGNICTSKSVGVVPYSGTFKEAIVWAHEIGHILGMNHDEEKDEKSSCYYDSGHVMGAKLTKPRKYNFVFSACSRSWIRDKVEKLDAAGTNCLEDGDKGKTVSGPHFGQLVTADDVCRRAFSDQNAFVDKKHYKTNQEDICVKLYCQSKPYWRRQYVRETTWTPQGMSCGKNKECLLGKCVETDTGSPFVSDACPLGDQLKTGYEGQWNEVCGKIDLSFCDVYGKDCCHSCNTTNAVLDMTADEVCQALDEKDAVFNRGAYSTYGDDFCSKIKCMRGKVGRGFKTKSYDTPDGMACGKEKRCYKGKCVKNRHKATTIQDSSCPFGDQDLKAIGYRGSCPQQSCVSWKKYCCASCKGQI